MDTPELEKEYERIVVEVFSELGRNREELLAEEEGVEIWKFLVEFQGKFVGAGRIAKTGDVYNLQRGSILKEYRLHGLHQGFSRLGVEFVKTIKKPHETVETYVHVLSRKSAERAGFVVDFSVPMRLDASPLIYYKATLPSGQI